jgi:2-C-methyl-D-erythritol 2,4-cyclodiphosphate synthase
MRVGSAFVVRGLVPGQRLLLGGVDIPFHKGVDGSCQADVLLHAIADALLGALALGDLGTVCHQDPRWTGADGGALLRHVVSLVGAGNHRIGNLDATIVGQLPDLGPFIGGMRARVAVDLGCTPDRVSVKATRVPFAPQTDDIAVMATVLIDDAAHPQN